MLRQLLISFCIFLSIAIIALLVVFVGKGFGYWNEAPSFLWPTLIVLTLVTLTFHAGSLYWTSLRPTNFAQLFLLSLVMKLMLYLGYAFVMIIMDPTHAPANVLFFFSIYVPFTLVETVTVYRKISAKQALEPTKKNF